jgi:hypothetical protein
MGESKNMPRKYIVGSVWEARNRYGIARFTYSSQSEFYAAWDWVFYHPDGRFSKRGHANSYRRCVYDCEICFYDAFVSCHNDDKYYERPRFKRIKHGKV